MNSITIKQFTSNIQNFIKQAIDQHIPLKITNQDGADFIIISAEDWEQQQETLYVLQNKNLMEQITLSMSTHIKHQGYSPNEEEINEIFNI